MKTAVRPAAPRPKREAPQAAGPPSAPGAAPVRQADAPVRIETAMPRALYDRLTGHDGAPRCRYETATGRAEFVAEPGVSHEWRASAISRLLVLIADLLDASGQASGFLIARASRLLSDDGAFEPDESLFIGRARADAAMQVDGYLDVRAGHPAPDLVVEIDRSVAARDKLALYFRMGIREVWTWSRQDGARLWLADPDTPGGFRSGSRSAVLPGLERAALDRLLAGRSPTESDRLSRSLVHVVADTIQGEHHAGGAPPRRTTRR